MSGMFLRSMRARSSSLRPVGARSGGPHSNPGAGHRESNCPTGAAAGTPPRTGVLWSGYWVATVMAAVCSVALVWNCRNIR